MRPGAIKWISAAVLLILGVRVTRWWRERSVTAASHRATGCGGQPLLVLETDQPNTTAADVQIDTCGPAES